MARGNNKFGGKSVKDLLKMKSNEQIIDSLLGVDKVQKPTPKVKIPPVLSDKDIAADIRKLKNSEGMKYWMSLFPKADKFSLIDRSREEGADANIVKMNFQDFLTDLRLYQQDTTSSEVRKTFKARLLESFLKLPEPIRNEISLPRDKIGGLMRGAQKATSEIKLGANSTGIVVSSFTADPEKAKWFSGLEGGVDKAKKAPRIYTSDDIDSFDGIIDVNRAYRFKNAFNEMPEVTQRYASIQTLGGNMFPAEQEFLVYGIKWKPGVA